MAHGYKKKQTPCDDNCGGSGQPKPELLPSNREVISIYNCVRGQLIVSTGGVVDLNYPALFAVMELYEIEDRVTCFERVAGVFRYFLNEQNKQEGK